MLTVFWNRRTERYYAQYIVAGVKHQFSCHTRNRKQATAFASKVYLERLTASPAVPCADRLSLTQFRDEYIRALRGRYSKKSIKTILDSFNQLTKRIGDLQLSDITVREMENFIYSGQPSAQTSARHYRTLRAIFNKGVKWKLIGANPLLGFDKPLVVEESADYFTVPEFQLLVSQFDTSTFAMKRLRNIAVLAFETGMRLGELLNVSQRNVSLDDRWIDVCSNANWRTKSGKNRRVPLTQRAVDTIIDQLRDNRQNSNPAIQETEVLFPNERGTILSIYYVSEMFRNQCRSTFPARRLHFHSLRHSMAKRAFLTNIPVYEIQQILGHSTVALTEKYGTTQRRSFPVFLEKINQANKSLGH